MKETELEDCVKEYNYLLDEGMKLFKRADAMRKYAKELYAVDIAHDRSIN